MMKEIADNEFYTMKVDEGKNRLYFTIRGFWKDQSQVPDYLNDIAKAARSTSKGFTVLSELTKMKTPSDEIGELHVKAQSALIKAGLTKTAEVHPESAVAGLSLKRFSEESGMKKGLFKSKEEAEKWLDS